MSFREFQSIWDSQKIPEDSVDREALTRSIKAKHHSFNKIANLTDIVMTSTLIFLGLMFMRDPILQGHDLVLLVASFTAFIAAGFVWSRRIARKKRELNFSHTLLGIVEKSIDGIDDYVGRMKRFILWFGVPSCIGLLIGVIIVDEAKRHLFYLVFIPATLLCIGLAHWQVRREIRLKLLPERQKLEQLRRKLIDEESPSSE